MLLQRQERRIKERTDQRTPFERDRDRLIHSLELRRLAGVTQVVNSIEGHTFHNRLTHTLKVAQIARRLAENLLEKNTNEKDLEKLGGLDANIVETAALAHDLGHPPFGHIGERVLDDLVSSKGNPDGYEGNAQSFRIITKLANRRPNMLGLNLTLAARRSILKYPWEKPDAITMKTERAMQFSKWGAYATEREELNESLKLGSSLISNRMSLEAAIMDLADDISYAIHDLEDFYKADLIPLYFITHNTNEEKQRFLDSVINDRKSPQYSEDAIVKVFNRFINLLYMDPYNGSKRQKNYLRMVFSNLIRDYITSTSINEKALYEENLPLLKMGETGEKLLEIKILKDLTHYYVINSRKLATLQTGHKKIIRDLFAILYKEAEDDDISQIFPGDYEEMLEDELKAQKLLDPTLKSDEIKSRAIARICADLISRMTDQEAIRMHQRLTGISSGSIYDYISE